MDKEKLIEWLKKQIALAEERKRFYYEHKCFEELVHDKCRQDAYKAVIEYVEGEVNV